MATRKNHKIVTMADGRESAKHEPYAFINNGRVQLEKSLSSICLLMLVFTDFGGEPLDARIAHGLAIALDQLTDVTHGLYSYEEMVERGGQPHFKHSGKE